MFHRTERLLLRPFWPEDAAAVFAGINNPLVLKNLSSPPSPYSMADAVQFCARPFDELLPAFAMIRRTKGAPELIGSIGLDVIGDGDPAAGQVQIGYWLAQSHWGLGYTTEAARAVLAIADTIGHTHVIGRHFIDNRASGRVLQKLGFRTTGRILSLSSPARITQAPAIEMMRETHAVATDADSDASDARFRIMYTDSETIRDSLAA